VARGFDGGVFRKTQCADVIKPALLTKSFSTSGLLSTWIGVVPSAPYWGRSALTVELLAPKNNYLAT